MFTLSDKARLSLKFPDGHEQIWQKPGEQFVVALII